MRHSRLRIVFAAIVFVFAGCGSSGSGTKPDGNTNPDGSLPIDAPDFQLCGDGMVQGSEQCDDGNDINDDSCKNDCTFSCGDGVLAATEACDTAIATGSPGACPTSCDDGDSCTTDALSGTACQTMCSHGAITAFVNGDGCCPAGGTSTNDSDCTSTCGNGVVEAGETCDTMIAAGMPGACPTGCDDGQACTADALAMAGTCMAACSNTPITTPMSGDGCCPAGATHATDLDCPAGCGDGVVTPPETCDTGIPSGAGSCPMSCDDANACTTDALLSAGTCSATCTHTAITAPMSGDGCCPPGANQVTDNDCAPVCGNGVIETGEACDDGNTTSGDGCSATCATEVIVTAMRFTDMDLRDPHVYVSPFFGCSDLTDTGTFGYVGVNPDLQNHITMDGNGDGNLDLSPILLFEPLNQTAGASTPMEVLFGTCTAPMSSTTCTSGGATLTPTTGTNMSVTCLGTLPGTTYAGYTAYPMTFPGGPCFVTGTITLPVTLSGIVINLQNAQIAGTYMGSPASGLVNGFVRGFISEADANATILPMSLPLIGGHPLSYVLPGGMGCCESPGGGSPDAHDDRDVGPDGTTIGWWFYLNFSATVRPYTP